MVEQPVDRKTDSAAGWARGRPDAPSFAELRAAILAIDYREDWLEQHRARVDAALDALVAESFGRGEHVETLIVRIKQVCAEAQPTNDHRVQRTWLVQWLVGRCITRYYAALS